MYFYDQPDAIVHQYLLDQLAQGTFLHRNLTREFLKATRKITCYSVKVINQTMYNIFYYRRQ